MMTTVATDFDQLDLPGSIVTIGTFDGVHRGHHLLLRQAVDRAAELDLPSVVVSFEPIPAMVLRPDRFRGRICGPEEKQERLLSVGADVLLVVEFTRELASWTAEEFVVRLLAATGMRELWVGEAFALGKNRAGDTAHLTMLGERDGFTVRAVARLEHAGGIISSSSIREAVISGRVEEAASLLGREFQVSGEVIRGFQFGRTIGYPTANVAPPEGLVPLADGIYASTVRLPGDERIYPSMTYVGTRPSVNSGARAIETHLLDFDGDLYGKIIDVAIRHRFRPDQHFPSIEELVAQLRRDEDATRAYFASHDPPFD